LAEIKAPVTPEIATSTDIPVQVTQPVYTSSQSETTAKLYIYNRESGNNTFAINASSGACGLGQALPCSKMGCSLSDYNCQDSFFTTYAMQRYGSWIKAQNFWINNHWW
jgi:hypothetical protein